RALEAVQRERPLEVVLFEAATLPPALLDGILANTTLRVERGRPTHGGTAPLEVGLVGTPMIVLYRVSFLTSLLGRALVRVPHIGLVNLVLGREVAPELVQDDVNPERIRSVVERLLGDRASLLAMRRALQPLRERLGESGASPRA